jgi:thiol-disulfide isomerase/thioredoxin
MNKSLRLCFALAAVSALAAGCKPGSEASAAANSPADAPAGAGLKAAPEWHLKDVDGRPVSSADFKGKVVVVDFWATWCPPCRSEIPGYVALQKKYAKDGLVIVGVSVDQGGPAVVRKFVEKFGVAYTILMADAAVIQAFGGIDAIPTTFLIDRDGNIRDRKVGAIATAAYEKRILKVLAPPDI